MGICRGWAIMACIKERTDARGLVGSLLMKGYCRRSMRWRPADDAWVGVGDRLHEHGIFLSILTSALDKSACNPHLPLAPHTLSNGEAKSKLGRWAAPYGNASTNPFIKWRICQGLPRVFHECTLIIVDHTIFLHNLLIDTTVVPCS